MPKLKKLSQKKSKNKESKEQEIENNKQENCEDCSLKANLAKPKKMKMRQRVKMLQNSKEQDEKRTQKRYSKIDQETNKYNNSHQVEIILSKYTDDDIDTIDEKSFLPQKQKKVKKNETKTSNKMFFAFQLQESKQKSNYFSSEQPQEFQLQVNKKQRRQSDNLLNKVDHKVNEFKKKLQYKDLNKDHKYKKNIKQKLKSIEEAQEINISVQVPKVFGGKHAHLEAAIFLKNKKQLSTQEKAENNLRQSLGQEQSMVLKDRRQYYQELGKQMKLKKAETLTENILKQCFKKSQLQDLDFLPDLGHNSDKRQTYDEKYQSCSIQKIKLSENLKKQSSLEDRSFSQYSQNQTDIAHLKEQAKIINKLPQIIRQKQQSQPKDSQNKQHEEVKQQVIPLFKNNSKLAKQKSKKSKKPALKKNFQFSKYVQMQADISDDQQEGGPGHKDDGDQSDDQEQTQISSLIDDDDVEQDSRDRGLIHRKYLQDMIQKEEQQYRQMKQKMQKKYLEQEENLRKRMKEAAFQNKQKEQKYDSVQFDQVSQSNQNQESKQKSNDNTNKLNNEAKLKELEQRLNLNKKQGKGPLPQTQITGFEKLKEIQAAVRITSIGPIRKAVRNGLQNMLMKQKHKSKPKK